MIQPVGHQFAAESIPHQVSLLLTPSPEMLELLRMFLTRATFGGGSAVADPAAFLTSYTAPDPAPDRLQAQTPRPETTPVQPPAEPPQNPATAGSAEPDGGHMTLLDAYAKYVEPTRLATASAKQRSRHRKAATQFAEFLQCSEKYNHRLSRPMVLVDGCAVILRDFAQWLICERKLSPTTVNHRMTDLLMIASILQKRGLIRSLPEKPPLTQLKAMRHSGQERPARKVPKSVSFADVQQLMDACEVARYPLLGDIPAPDFWRASILWHATFGPRTQDIYAYLDKSKTGLQWSDVFFGPECPDPELQQALPGLTSPHGWLYYPVSKDKKSDCPYVLFPMPQWMAAFLQRLRGLEDRAGQNRVLPVARSPKHFAQAWSAIRTAAGVSDTVYLSQGTGGVCAFRKTSAKWWRRVTDSKEVAQYVLHHAEVTTADTHYLDTMEVVVPQLLQHLPTFPITWPNAPAAT